MAQEKFSSEKTVLQESKQLFKWQNRLMPWMITVPTVLIGLFIVFGTMQLNKFDNFMYDGGKKEVEKAIPSPVALTTDSNLRKNMEYLRWYSLVQMEEHSINRRYQQGGVLLMSRIYIKYLGFFTGMILAIVGSVFIISRLKEDVSELEGSIQEKNKFKLVSSSPGIIFGILGTTLMMATILKHSEINVKDMPLYLNPYNVSQIQRGDVKKDKKPTIDQNEIDQLNMEPDTARGQ